MILAYDHTNGRYYAMSSVKKWFHVKKEDCKVNQSDLNSSVNFYIAKQVDFRRMHPWWKKYSQINWYNGEKSYKTHKLELFTFNLILIYSSLYWSSIWRTVGHGAKEYRLEKKREINLKKWKKNNLKEQNLRIMNFLYTK